MYAYMFTVGEIKGEVSIHETNEKYSKYIALRTQFSFILCARFLSDVLE